MGVELVGRVSRAMLIALGPAAACGGLLAGWSGVVGALAGCLVSLASFRWLSSAVASASVPGTPGPWRSAAALAVGLRHLTLFAALGVLLWAGAHPVALLAGLSVFPPILIGLGLRAAGLAR